MKTITEVLHERLDTKCNQLAAIQDALKTLSDEATVTKVTSCFERNMVINLHNMTKLKSEIEELSYIIELIENSNNLLNRRKENK